MLSYALIVFAIAAVGWFGGRLVYGHGVGRS